MTSDFNEHFRFGSANWASDGDVHAAGLLGDRGLIVGFRNNRILRYDGDAGALVFGGAGSGKLRDLLAYILCCSPGIPMLVLDPRGELGAVSMIAHTRNGEYAYYWNPYGVAGLPRHRCNPLAFLRLASPYFHTDCKGVAEALIVSSGSAEGAYFEIRGRSWLADLIISLVWRDGYVSFLTLYRLINIIESDPQAWADHLNFMLGSPFENVRRTAGEIDVKQSNSPREFGSIVGAIYAGLGWLDDPTLLDFLGGGDFELADLCYPGPTRKIFLICPAEFLSALAPLLRTFLTVAMLEKARRPDAPRVTLLADEAGQLGRSETLLRSFTFGRGMGVRAVGLFQDRGQVIRHYGEAGLRGFEGSAACQIAFGIRDYVSAEDYSRRIGEQTLRFDDERLQEAARRQQRMALQRLMLEDDFLSAAYDYRHFAETAAMRSSQSRRLMTADELLSMREDQALIFLSGKGVRPILSQKYPYFSQPWMAGLYLQNPYHPPLDRVLITTGSGQRWAKVITERAPARFTHLPQHQSGEISYVEGHRFF